MFNNFFKKPKKAVEYFIALQISEATVGAAVFTSENGKAKILGTSFENYSEGWDNLTETTDLAVSKAAGEVSLSDIRKVVFGFHPSFLEGDKISKNKLPYLKKLTTELELTPSGFVVIPEAINFYLEEKESGPQTSILVGITKNELTVSLFRGGKLTDQIIIQRTQSINKDIQSALEKFSDVEIFPSKILLYDGGDLETVKEELLKYPWQSNSKFLHFPKIETLAQSLCLQSIVEAAVSELNKTIEGLEQKEVPQMQSSQVVNYEVKGAKKVSPESLGFIKESQDVAFNTPLEQETSNYKEDKKGFKLSFPKISIPWLTNKPQSHQIKKEEEIEYKRDTSEHKRFSFPTVRLPGSGKARLFAVGLIMALIILGGGYIFASYSLPKATITLIVDPKVFDQEKEVSINPDILTPSQDTNEIPGKILEVGVSGTKTIPTTGKKIIGEEAKGSITIYNKTTSSRVFEKSTKVSAKNLVFVLDDKADVSAASESVDGLTYGKANVSVTAAKIGPEGNLPSQTEFIIEDFSNSSYLARNEQAFSGGTSREVNSVSSKDQESLLSQTSNELKEQAKKDLLQKLVDGEKLLEESLNGEVETRKFSHEADQETKELNLNLTMKYQGMVYQEKDFTTLMEKMLSSNVPQGYEFRPSETTLSVSEGLSTSDKTFKFKATFTARLFPKIDTEKIKKEISGLSVNKLESYVKTVSNVVGYEVAFDTPLSFFKNNLPRSLGNITIEVKAR